MLEGVTVKIFFLASLILSDAAVATINERSMFDANREKVKQKIIEVHVQYEQPENNSKTESQTKILLRKEGIVRQQQVFRLLVIVTLGLLIVLIFLLFKGNKARKSEKSYLEAKVNDHTLELQYMYDILERSYNEQKQSIQKTSREMKEQLTTMRGLCSLIKLESTDNTSDEFVKDLDEKINSLSKTLDNISTKEYLIKYDS